MPYASFVSRQPELAQLDAFYTQASHGQGQVCYITGDAGSGKSTLVREFCRHIQERDKNAIVAFGQSDAETGVGDPNLLFREILSQLTGNLDSDLAQNAITHENASRLRTILNLSIQALVDVGPDLLGVFLPGAGILARVGAFAADKGGLTTKLETLLKRHPQALGPSQDGLEQDHIFEQYTNVIRSLSQHRPLILVLDDLHWADQASISLLFHLGRRITQNRVLIVGTYRPEEIALGRFSSGAGQQQRHPLEKILAEMKRYYGDIVIDLGHTARSSGHHFVNALLDTEPNALGPNFREALFNHTQGNPLFVIELLREMQARGDITQNKGGEWIEGSSLNWRQLPARVEGVIQERIGRLNDALQEILTVASVEGDTFTAEIVAEIQQVEARMLIRQFSRELHQRHQLVTGQGVKRLPAGQRLSLFQFNHKLLQTYLYNSMDEVQRVLTHEDIGYLLEELYQDNVNEVIVQLARHFVEAGLHEKSVHYLLQAGEQASAQFAYENALDYFNRALGLLDGEPETAQRYQILTRREHAHHKLGRREVQHLDLVLLTDLAQQLDTADPIDRHSRSAEVALRQAAYAELTGDYEAVIQSAQQAIDLAHTAQHISAETQGYLAWGQALWRQSEWTEADYKLQTALKLAREANLTQEEASSLRNLGIVAARMGNYSHAHQLLAQALVLYQQIHDRHGQTITYNAMGVFAAEQGDFDKARAYFTQTLDVYREIGDRWGEGAALSNLGQVCTERGNFSDAQQYLEQALEICTQIDDREGEGTLCNNLGQMANEQGDYGAARKYLQRAIGILGEIGNQRVEGFALANLGLTYLHSGSLDLSGEYLDTSYQVLRAIDDPQGQSLVLTYRALRFHHMGENATAREVSMDALRIAKNVGDRAAQAYALTTLGHALAELGETSAALDAYHRALEIRQELEQPNLAVEIQVSLLALAIKMVDEETVKPQVESLLVFLESGNIFGLLEPLRVYTTCARVLQTLKDERAGKLLEKADLLLHRQAYRIQDPDLEAVFLTSKYALMIKEMLNAS